MNWNLLGEVLGFLSGCLLLWPAIAQNRSLRNAAKVREIFERTKSKIGKVLGKSASLREATVPRWSAIDQWLLTIGTLLLLLSFGAKLLALS